MTINKNNFFYFTFIYCLFIIFIWIFHLQLGIPQIYVIMLNLSLCIVFYLSFKMISNRISLHLESKSLGRTSAESREHLIKPRYNYSKSKNSWKYKNIFFIKFCIGISFFLLLVIPLIYIFTVIHEFAHAITGLVNGVQIEKIQIFGPREGITNHSVLNSNFTLSLLSISGSLGEILFGIFLLVIIYRNRSMKLDILIPIYFVIGINFMYVYLYWHTSLHMGIGDAASILFYNPGLSPQLLLIVGYLVFIGLMVYLILNLWRSINHRKNLFIEYYYPDIVGKRIFSIIKNLFLKKT